MRCCYSTEQQWSRTTAANKDHLRRQRLSIREQLRPVGHIWQPVDSLKNGSALVRRARGGTKLITLGYVRLGRRLQSLACCCKRYVLSTPLFSLFAKNNVLLSEIQHLEPCFSIPVIRYVAFALCQTLYLPAVETSLSRSFHWSSNRKTLDRCFSSAGVTAAFYVGFWPIRIPCERICNPQQLAATVATLALDYE